MVSNFEPILKLEKRKQEFTRQDHDHSFHRIYKNLTFSSSPFDPLEAPEFKKKKKDFRFRFLNIISKKLFLRIFRYQNNSSYKLNN